MRPLVCLALVTGVLAAAAPPARAQTVDDLVARHVAERGGYERLKNVQTLKITRTVATTFSTLRVVVYKKRPSLHRLEQGPTTPGAALVPRIVTPAGTWDTTAGKLVPRSAALAAETLDLEGDFDGLLVDWRAKGHTVTAEGKKQLPSGDAYVLRVMTRNGAERLVYLDASTFLERRHTGVLRLPGVGPDGAAIVREMDVVIDFDNYREVDGVLFPFDITEERTGREPAQSLVTYTEKIEVNMPLDDSLFAVPAGG